MIDVYIDGLVGPVNPGGVGTIGIVIYKNGEKIYQKGSVVGEGPAMSNNRAEYEALGEALRWLLDEGLAKEQILVRSDSRLLVNQMQNKWKVGGGLFVVAYKKARKLVEQFASLSFQWIPRGENEEADLLTKEAYEEYVDWRALR